MWLACAARFFGILALGYSIQGVLLNYIITFFVYILRHHILD